jgi:2-dehydropantoate 2-reductase
MALPGPVTVMGAGSIGCFVGGCLQAAGAEVHFVGRDRVLADLHMHGLHLSDLGGRHVQLPAAGLRLHDTPPAGSALVLLCVKSGATAEAARLLPARSLVVSLQNGIANAGVAAAAAPSLTVLPGMVGFNVAELGPGHFHRGTEGAIAVQDHPGLAPWRPLFGAAGLPLACHADL